MLEKEFYLWKEELITAINHSSLSAVPNADPRIPQKITENQVN
jgi:hypothetical protein